MSIVAAQIANNKAARVYCRNKQMVHRCSKADPDPMKIYAYSTGQGLNWNFVCAVNCCRRCLDKLEERKVHRGDETYLLEEL